MIEDYLDLKEFLEENLDGHKVNDQFLSLAFSRCKKDANGDMAREDILGNYKAILLNAQKNILRRNAKKQ